MTTNIPAGGVPERVGDVPAARLLRVIADRIDQGWPAPDSIDLNRGTLPDLLSFHHRPGAADQWIELFEAAPDDEPKVREATNGNYTHQRFTGQHLGADVEIDVYLAVQGGEPR